MNNPKADTMKAASSLPQNWKSGERQNGAVLAVSLIMLLLITLIAVSSMQSTMLEEKMAGNTRDRNLAFQTTESGTTPEIGHADVS